MEALEVMITRLKTLKLRYQQLEHDLMEPALLANQREYAKVAKEQATLRQIVEAYEDLDGLFKHIDEATQM
jgi:peptide chain release factor 1